MKSINIDWETYKGELKESHHLGYTEGYAKGYEALAKIIYDHTKNEYSEWYTYRRPEGVDPRGALSEMLDDISRYISKTQPKKEYK